MVDNLFSPAIIWFRNDLRLSDHHALTTAVKTGRPVLPIFIFDENAAGPWAPGGATRWWLHYSLASLTLALRNAGAPLVLRRGSTVAEIVRIARDVGAKDVYAGDTPEPWARALGKQVMDALAAEGVAFHLHRTAMLFDQETVRTKSGDPFSVYTPFARACLETGGPPPPLPPPPHIQTLPVPPASDELESWGLLPEHPDWAGGLRATWEPGEPAAQRKLGAFVADAMKHYADLRDRPDKAATSMLSPYLHFGEVSATQVWHAAPSPRDRGGDKFLHELLWREFSTHLLWHHPTLPEAPIRASFADMPWRDDAAALRAWQHGRTGIPIVDAGMRQLWQTGWMHNRVRLIAASFLTKHLLIRWQQGEAWFWDTLVDADLGNNSASWQWVAGCGADAAPYFRIFNPTLQGKKFDPDGDYVRRFVPELAQLPRAHIHAPWEASEIELREAAVELGRTYPRPIIDLPAGRARALEAFARTGRSAG